MKHFTITPENPKGIYIDLTSEEIAQRQLDEQQAAADKIIKEQKIATELANKQSAMSKLKALGLNDAEIKSIIG
jgi:hypothetical protein